MQERPRYSNAEQPADSANSPLERALELLAGKWTSALLSTLAAGALRYRDLRARLGRLSDKMLTQRLRDLQRKGLVRHVYVGSERRCRVYQLTDLAESLKPIMKVLHDWGERHSPESGRSLPALRADASCMVAKHRGCEERCNQSTPNNLQR
jgi:DNA-binding HxlR family transcriptional regulator